jgi:hypothetical protein
LGWKVVYSYLNLLLLAGDFNVMVMEILGPSLEDLFNFCKQNFSLKTVLMLGDMMIRRIGIAF